MTKAQRIKRYNAIRTRYEKFFYAPLKRVMKAQISSFADILKSQGVEAVRSAIRIDTDLAKVIEQMYVRPGLASANETLSFLLSLPKRQAKRRTFGHNTEWTRAILAYFNENLFNKVVLPIGQTTQEYILQVVSKGIDEGWSIERMTREIEREDYLDGRVRRILRTEINRAINYGNTLAEEKFEYKTLKEWNAVHDNRTRHPHLSADGQQVELSGMFVVDGELMEFPGDPNASAKNVCNCRCMVLINAQRDGNGRLIPKENTRPLPRVRGRLRSQLRDILAELTA